MKRFLAIALAFALSACSTIANFTINQNAVDSARQSYNIAFLVPAKNYRQLGYCATGTKSTVETPCADRNIVAKLRIADAAVAKNFDNLQAMIDSGDSIGIIAAYKALMSAIDAAKSVLPTGGE